MINFSPRALSKVVTHVMMSGEEVMSERGNTIEVQDALLHLDNPLDRVSIQKWRKMNLAFAIVDALSFIIGDNKLEPITQFVPGFAKYSTNGRTIDGSYGNRIHTAEQLNVVIEMLKKNPMTRRAVLNIYMGPVDLLGGGGLNTPCTLNMHFLVREGKLNMKVMMRSNDVILGLTNDVFNFTMLHEYVSLKTNIPLGEYTHFASSLHLYEDDVKKFRIDEIWATPSPWPYVMNEMPATFNPNRVYDAICKVKKMSIHECLRLELGNQYETDLFLTCAFFYHRHDVPNVKQLAILIEDATLNMVSNYWIEKE